MASENLARMPSISAWRRPNGRVAVRNHVIVMALDDASDAAGGAIAHNVDGVLHLPSRHFDLQYRHAPTIRLRALIGTAANPNVAAAVIVGADESLTRRIVAEVARTGKPAASFSAFDDDVVAAASGVANEYARWAGTLKREAASVADLWISTKCDESDATTGLASCPMIGNMYDKLIPRGIYGVFGEAPELAGAASLVGERAANREVEEKWLSVCRVYGRQIDQVRRDTRYVQPTLENIEAGITTPEEKALGSLQKIGRLGRYIDVLEPGELPARGPGLYYMNTSSETECALFMAAAGYVLHVLASGRGNVLGSDIVPVVQITANPRTFQAIPAHIDVDATPMIRGRMSVGRAGDALIDMIQQTASGRPTAAEVLSARRK